MVVRGLTRLTRKGQVTVPANIRHAMGLTEGDRVEVELEADGSARLRRARSVVEATYGALKSDIVLTEEQEKEAIAEGWLQRERRMVEQSTPE